MSDTASAPSPEEAKLRSAVNALMPRLRQELEDLVRIPSVAFDGFPTDPVTEAGAAVARLMTAAGMPGVRILDVPGAPHAVYGRRPAPAGGPTVLLYAHYDVQPEGDAGKWQSKAFEPAVRDGRLYGRGASDDKAGVVMHAGALLALGDRLPVGITVFIEGQEEAGMGELEEFVRRHPEFVQADAIVVADLGNYALGVPTLTTSLRGLTAFDVEVETLEGPVHSGTFGGVAPDALVALVRMLATLHDDAGNVAVKGLLRLLYDGAEYDEAGFRSDAGVLPGVGLVGIGSLAERLYMRPSINVIGMDVPAADGAGNALVPKALARVSVRLCPGQDPEEALAILHDHLLAVAPWKVRVSVTRVDGGDGFLAKTDGPAYAAAADAMRAAYGHEVVHYGEGGSIPLVNAFINAVPGAEIIMWGAEEPLCKIHAPNESVDLEELERCVLAETLFLAGLAGKV